MMGKYRNRLQIIADILSAIVDGARKTHVMYQANLSYTLVSRYLTEVLDAGLVRRDKDGRYRLTKRGQNFLSRFSEYTERCDQLEQELNNVSDEKKVLEKMVNINLNRRSNKPLRKKMVA